MAIEQVFATAKLPLVRVLVRYNTGELASLFQAAMQTPMIATGPIAASEANPTQQTPTCPKCGVPMVRRVARRGNTPGRQFWGCSNYPRCREITQATDAIPVV